MTDTSNIASIRTRSRWLFPWLFLVILVAGIWFASFWSGQTDREMRSDLILKAHLVTHTIDTERLNELTGTTADLPSPEYVRLKQQLADARKTISQCRFIYLMGQQADKTVFIYLDSEPPDSIDASPPGQIYEEVSVEYRHAFATRQAQVVGPITDRWGTWVTALIPVTDSATGELQAVLGMDIDARYWQKTIIRRAWLPAVGAMLALWCILFAYMFLAGKRKKTVPSTSIWMENLEPALLFAVGIVLSCFAAIISQQQSDRGQQNAFQQLAESRTAKMMEFFHDLERIELESLARFYENSQKVTEDEFRNFTAYLMRNQALYLWAWLEAVPQNQRQDFETLVRNAGPSDFQIWAHDADANRVPAPANDMHYVLHRMVPAHDADRALGFDLASNHIRRQAIEEAIQTGLPTATDPLQLILDLDDENLHSMLLLRPVFTDAARSMPRGLAITALRLEDALYAAQSDALVRTELFLAMDNNALQTLTTTQADDIENRTYARFLRPVFAFGRTFIISATPGPDFLQLYPARGGLLAALIGSLLTSTLTIIMALVQQRTRTLQRLVRERTDELERDIAQRMQLEITLQTQNTILRTQQEISPDAILVVDENDRIASCNQQFGKLCGLTCAEMLHKKAQDMLAQVVNNLADPEAFITRGQKLNKSREIEEQHEILRKDGIVLQRFSYPIVTNNGNYHGRIWYYRDITEQKRKEEYGELNRNILEILNQPGDFGASITQILNAIREQIGMKAVGIRLQNGEDFPYIAQQGFSDDFLQRESSLLERGKDGRVCRTSDGAPSLECTCGLVLAGKTNPENPLFTPRGSAWTNDSRSFLNAPHQQDAQHLTRNTCIHKGYASIALIPIRTGNTIIGLLHLCDHRKNRFSLEIIRILENICDHIGAALQRKQAETKGEKLQQQLLQAQKLESVGRLAGGISHDFNNMLQAIMGSAELAFEHTDPSQPIYHDLKEIQKCAQRSADLTRQLLTFARKQTIAPQVIDLNETVEGMFKMLHRIIGEDIKLTWSPGQPLPLIKADPMQINQILANLCVNARDAIEQNGTITIKTTKATLTIADFDDLAEAAPGEYAMLTVTDNGHGMDQATRAQAFEPFFTTKKVGEGTGLGLSSVYGAVKQNHGTIQIESEPGKGSSIKIFLPQHIGQQITVPEKTEDHKPKGSETILLTEDDTTILALASKMLTSLGYNVITAASPEEAIQLVKKRGSDIDLVMTDVIMPQMNGQELAKKIRAITPAIKILFMSGYTADIIANQGVLENNTRFIQKPFSLQELATELRLALA